MLHLPETKSKRRVATVIVGTLGLGLLTALPIPGPRWGTASETPNSDKLVVAARAMRHPLELLAAALSGEMDRILQIVRRLSTPGSDPPEVRIGKIVPGAPGMGNCGPGMQLVVRDTLAKYGILLAPDTQPDSVEIGGKYWLERAAVGVKAGTTHFVSLSTRGADEPAAEATASPFESFRMELLISNRQGRRVAHVLAIKARDVEPYRWDMFVDFLTARRVRSLEPGTMPEKRHEVRIYATGGGQELRTPKFVGDKAFVRLERDETFLVELTNPMEGEVVAQLFLDGVSVFRFSDDRDKYEYILIPARSSVKIPGWHRNNQHTSAFKICDYTDSALAHSLQNDVSEVGTITARFAKAWSDPASRPSDELAARGSDVPLAVGFGGEVAQEYRERERYVSSSWETVSVCYSVPTVEGTAPSEPPDPQPREER